MSQPLNIILVERPGTLKMLAIKDFKEEELFKKCGFKKADDFLKQTEWNTKYDGKKYFIQVFAKDEGRANSENKYDFPPPIDNKLFFGCCALVCQTCDSANKKVLSNLSLELWNKIYEKLFGGFTDLTIAKDEDDDDVEEDELDTVPKSKKTKKGGYLKDGFVVDSSDAEELTEDSNDDESSEEEEMDEDNSADLEEDIVIEDLGSELSEESYDYESESSK